MVPGLLKTSNQNIMTDILQITKEKAHKAYAAANDTLKQLLENIFGKEHFVTDFGKQITTFEEGLVFKGITAADVLPIVPAFMKEHETRQHALAKLFFLGDIYRNGWIPDYSNPNQRKFYPWEIYKSGSGLSLGVVAYVDSATAVAARLTFQDEKTVREFEENFRQIYNDFML